VAGLDVEAHLDSGSMGPLTFPQAVADKLDFTREPTVVGKASTGFNEFEIKEAPLDGDVRIGSHVMEDPTVAIFGMFPTANLGGQVLQNFAITFDQKNGRLRFTRDEDRPIETKPRYRVGVMMFPGPEGLVVEGVIPGGAGEKAGLKEGDRIISINGEAAEELGAARLRETFGSPEPIRVTVEREGEEVELVVTPSRADQG
jgi:membrane-associated protease RseP (regulator of RpoE activity)